MDLFNFLSIWVPKVIKKFRSSRLFRKRG